MPVRRERNMGSAVRVRADGRANDCSVSIIEKENGRTNERSFFILIGGKKTPTNALPSIPSAAILSTLDRRDAKNRHDLGEQFSKSNSRRRIPTALRDPFPPSLSLYFMCCSVVAAPSLRVWAFDRRFRESVMVKLETQNFHCVSHL